MGKSSTTKASAIFNFRADLDVKCYDDQVEIEVDQTKADNRAVRRWRVCDIRSDREYDRSRKSE